MRRADRQRRVAANLAEIAVVDVGHVADQHNRILRALERRRVIVNRLVARADRHDERVGTVAAVISIRTAPAVESAARCARAERIVLVVADDQDRLAVVSRRRYRFNLVAKIVRVDYRVVVAALDLEQLGRHQLEPRHIERAQLHIVFVEHGDHARRIDQRQSVGAQINFDDPALRKFEGVLVKLVDPRHADRIAVVPVAPIIVNRVRARAHRMNERVIARARVEQIIARAAVRKTAARAQADDVVVVVAVKINRLRPTNGVDRHDVRAVIRRKQLTFGIFVVDRHDAPIGRHGRAAPIVGDVLDRILDAVIDDHFIDRIDERQRVAAEIDQKDAVLQRNEIRQRHLAVVAVNLEHVVLAVARNRVAPRAHGVNKYVVAFAADD